MSYADIYNAATVTDHNLRKQVAVALAIVAMDIANESAATADHSQRLAWARRVATDPVGWAEKAIWKVLENATIQAAPTQATDGDVLFVVISAIPYLMKLV
jgi:hypothetical protein